MDPIRENLLNVLQPTKMELKELNPKTKRKIKIVNLKEYGEGSEKRQNHKIKDLKSIKILLI